MSPEFYKKVTPLRKKITDLETDILSGRIAPTNIAEFNALFLNASTILDELKQVYRLSFNNTVLIKELDEYVQEQKSLLEFLCYFLDILKKNHEYYNIEAEATIQEEWKDIVCILRFNQIERKLEWVKQKYFDKKNFNVEAFLKDLEVMAPFHEKDIDFIKLACFLYLNEKGKTIGQMLNKTYEEEKEYEKYNNLAKEVDTILEKLKKINKNNINHSRIQECKSLLKEREGEYLDAVSSVLEPSDMPSKKYTDEERKDTEVDEEFFKQLTLTSSKIRYLSLILKNIEAKTASNNDYITVVRNGKERKIPRRFKVRYGSIKKRMEDLLIEYENKKDEEVLDVSSEVEKEIREEKGVKSITGYQALGIDEKEHEIYVTLQIEINNLKREMTRLVQKAKGSLKISEAIPVKLGEQTYLLLPEDVEKFNRYYEEYQKRKGKIATLSCGTEKEYADKEDAIYQKICALKESGADKEQIKIQLHKLRREQYRANRGKKNARFRNLLFFIRSLSIPKNLEGTYLKVAFSPDAFVRSKQYSDSVKKKALGNCLRLFKKREKSYAKVSDVALTLEGMSKKINAELENLPKNESNVVRIKKVKKANKMLKLKKFVDENASYFAAGFVGVLVATSTMFAGLSYHHHVTEQEMAEKYGRKPAVSSEENQEKVDSILAKLENHKEEKTLFEAINEVQEQKTVEKYGFSNPFITEKNTVSQNKVIEEDSSQEQKFVDKIVKRQKEEYAVMTKIEESLEMSEFTKEEADTSSVSLESDLTISPKMNQEVLLKADTYVVGTYEDLINFDEKELYTGETTVEQTGFVFKKSDGNYEWISNTDPEWERKWEECVLSGAEAVGFRGEKDLVGLGFFPMDSVEELGGQSR